MNDESIHRRLVTREDSFLKVVSLAGVSADEIKFVTRALESDDGRFKHFFLAFETYVILNKNMKKQM